jgi:hypothetical protein
VLVAPLLTRGAAVAAPSSVAESLSRGDGDTAVAFVLQNPREAVAATLADQAALLRLAARDRAKCDRSRADRELAALTLLQPIAGNAQALAAVTRDFGGSMRVRAILPAIESAPLRSILARAIEVSK